MPVMPMRGSSPRSPQRRRQSVSPMPFAMSAIPRVALVLLPCMAVITIVALGMLSRNPSKGKGGGMDEVVDSLVSTRDSFARDSHDVCVGYHETEFCSAKGPVKGGEGTPLAGCDTEVRASHSGVCYCHHNFTVEHYCEKGNARFTCRYLCASVLQNPAGSLGPSFRVLQGGQAVPSLPRVAGYVEGGGADGGGGDGVRARIVGDVRDLYEQDAESVQEIETLVSQKQPVFRYPRAEELKRLYGWPRQGGGYEGAKPNAVYLVLTTESRRKRLVTTLDRFERNVNQYLGYPYVVFNDKNFSDIFREKVSGACSTSVEYYQIPEKNWRVPDWIDTKKMRKGLKKHPTVPYMDSLSYRLMCRWNSGYFFREEVIAKYEYFWRVDDDVYYYCPLVYDPFVLMQERQKVYGFTIALDELMLTIKTLWSTVSNYARSKGIRPKWPSRLFQRRQAYTGCHFWSNFEIGRLDFFRSQEYLDYFDALDQSGGFFYERWGDAPVHTLAIMLLLEKDKVEYLESLGYAHSTIFHLPEDPDFCPNTTLPQRASGESIDRFGQGCLAQLEY